MNIIKDYLVTVRTINDGQVTAIKITDTSNNLLKDFTNDELLTNDGVSIGNAPATANDNDIELTKIYEDKDDVQNVNNPSIPPMNDSSIKKEDDLNQILVENPLKRDVIRKGDSRPISKSILVDNVPSKNQFNNISDHYKSRPINEKRSLIPQKDNSIIKGRKAFRGGMKSRRLGTRNNKKKTMRRNRRIL